MCVRQGPLGSDSEGEDDDKGEDNDKSGVLSAANAARHPKAELARLKKMSGGNSIRIAARLLTPNNLENLNVLLVVVQACWSLHSKRAKKKLTPEDGLLWSAQMTRDWQLELERMISDSLLDGSSLQSMGQRLSLAIALRGQE